MTFIYHENWTVQATPQTSLLRPSLYFSFTEKYPIRLSFVKTSLPWENYPDCPVLIGIPIHCSLLNRIMEVHTLLKMLPDKMMNLIVKEFDDKNIGQGTFNASHIIQSIKESNIVIKQSLLQTLGSSPNIINKNL